MHYILRVIHVIHRLFTIEDIILIKNIVQHLGLLMLSDVYEININKYIRG